MASRTRGRGGRGATAEATASESSMPPPATTRVTRSAQAQPREPDGQPQIIARQLEIPRRGTRREDRAPSKASIASISSLRSGRTGTEVFTSQPSHDPQGKLDFYRDAHLADDNAAVAASVVSEDVDTRDRETTVASVVETPAQRLASSRVMMKFLDRLFTASEDLLNVFLESESKQGEDVWVAELEKVQGPFSHYREHYYPDGSPYFLDLEYVLQRLDCDEGSDLGLDAARTIAMENLVSLLTNVKLASLGFTRGEDPLATLQGLDNAFEKILTSLRASQLSLWTDTEELNLLRIALDLRTQRFIQTYQQFAAENDPLSMLAHVFCHPNAVENADDSSALSELLDRGPYSKLMGSDINLNEMLRKIYHGRIKQISEMLIDEGEDPFTVNMDRLESEFPFDGFVEDVEDLVSDTFTAIDIARKNKPASLRSPSLALRSREESQADESQSDIMSQPIVRAPPGSSNPSLLNKNSVMALKQLESGASGSIPPSNQRAAAGSSRNANLWQASPTPASSSNNGALYAESAAVAAGKRPYEGDNDVHFDDDENDEFETDNRAPSSQRRAQAPGGKQPSPKRVRIAEAEMPPPPRPRVPPPSSAPAGSSSSVRHTSTPSQQQHLPPPPSSTEPDLQRLSQMSRQISVAARKTKEPQRRQAWSRDDTRLLIRAVEIYNCKWSTIEKLIKQGSIRFDHPRDQQALRDKARLVKVDFLKTDSVLPPGFDGVVLGAKERKIVIDVGRNPDRKEEDIDPETGVATNTRYIEDPEPDPFE